MANKLPSRLEQVLKEKFPGWTIESPIHDPAQKAVFVALKQEGKEPLRLVVGEDAIVGDLVWKFLLAGWDIDKRSEYKVGMAQYEYKDFPNVEDGQFRLTDLEYRVVEDPPVEKWKVSERKRGDNGHVFIVILPGYVKMDVERNINKKPTQDYIEKAMSRGIARVTRRYRTKGEAIPEGIDNKITVTLQETDFPVGEQFSK